jgi:hypothetical protein
MTCQKCTLNTAFLLNRARFKTQYNIKLCDYKNILEQNNVNVYIHILIFE